MKQLCFCFLSFCLLLITLDNFGQSTWLSAKGGLSIPKLAAVGNDNPLSSGYKSILGGNGALSAERKISNTFSLEVMIEYSAQGGKRNGYQAIQANPDPTSNQMYPYLYADINSTAHLDYLLIPILAKFTFPLGSKIKMYVDAGPFAGILLSAKQVTSGTSLIYLDANKQVPLQVYAGINPSSGQPMYFTAPPVDFTKTTDIKNQTHNGNFGIEGNLGFAFSLTEKSRIIIEGGGNYGLVNIQKDAANGKNNAGAGTVRVGYSFSIGK